MGCLSRLHRALVLRRWSAVEAEGPRVLGAGGRVRDGGAVEFLAYLLSGRGVRDNVLERIEREERMENRYMNEQLFY